ncbi:unnamed protein product, partial [Mesorhabditis belari]|uniref:G-protein coupled receptors family 1 profile domain-containing protein n=1 Tax=Mesorhabditis belari TaxID=2138241 RepID=A0AAF3EAR1_9BILA
MRGILAEFLEQRSGIEVGIVIAYLLIITIGAFGNLWVAWKCGVVLMFGRRQRQSTSVTRGIVVCIFIICLSDIIVLSALAFMVDMKITGGWRFGEVICRLFYMIEMLNKFVIPLCLVHISRLSFNSVKITRESTHRFHSFLLPTFNFVAIATVFGLSGYVLLFSKTLDIPLRRSRSGIVSTKMCLFNPPSGHDLIFNGVAFLVGYVVTSLAYIYFYASVPLLLKRKISSNNSPGAFHQLKDSNIVRIKYTVTSFVAIYLICWTPYWALFWLASLTDHFPRWLVMISMLVHTLPYLSCTAYPIVLTAMNRGIQNEHASILSFHKKKFSTIREGAMQTFSAHVGMLNSIWAKAENENLNPVSV